MGAERRRSKPVSERRGAWHGRRSRSLVGAACLVGVGALARLGAGQEAGAAVYVRADTDKTTVVTPRLRLGVPAGEDTDLDVVYVVDVWTSASIDIRTSASKAITEQRDEIDLSIAHAFDDVRVSAAYRYSTEPDYESHGGTLGLDVDLADKSTTLGVGVTGTFDDVGRVGDPGFSRDARFSSGRFSLTQVIDPDTLVQGIYELASAQGYLASPYRFVGIGGADGSCRGAVDYCIPETNPERRIQHAIALRGRRALGDSFSTGVGSRFYRDDWELVSHTAEIDVGWLPVRDTRIALRYRLYWQGAAVHYAARYPELRPEQPFYTRDKELSPFLAHRAGVDLEHAFALGTDEGVLRTLFSAGPTFYRYRDFPLLDEVTALEVTLALVLER